MKRRPIFELYTAKQVMHNVKCSAKRIKKRGDGLILHSEALNLAAKEKGFHNWADLVECCKNEEKK